MAVQIDFLGLQAFLAIAERGSFHKAAAHLGITQAALSHRMRKLEDYAGMALFHRTTRQVSLSPAGLELLPRAKVLVEEATRTFEDLARAAAGRQEHLAIGCLPTLAIGVLPAAISEFSKTYAGTHVRVFDNSAHEIAGLVQREEAAFGLTVAATGRWDLDFEPLATEPYVLVVPRDHPISARPAIAWSQLAGERLIRIAAQTGHRTLIDDALGAVRERLTWVCEVQHVASALALVEAGSGLTIVPRSAIEVFRAAHLVAVPLRGPGISRTLGLLTRRGVPLASTAVALARQIERRLASVKPKRRS